jgi:hypothetical protein
MSRHLHMPGCARLRHEPLRRVRCSCGADPHDTATPELCPACGGDLSWLTAWLTQVVVGGRVVNVVTCHAAACRAQSERLATERQPLLKGV